MKWKETKSAIMRASKVTHCPLCGELLSFFDRTHVKQKHPEYFHAVRKWQLASSLSLVSEAVFLIIGGLSADLLVKWFVVGGALIALAIALFFLLKWLSAAQKFRLSEDKASFN